MLHIKPESLGSELFTQRYGLRYAYLAGAMYKGIASKEMVVALGKAGLMGYFGAGGLRLPELEAAIRHIQRELRQKQAYGMNLLCNLDRPDLEEQVVDLYLRYDVRFVEAAAFMQITPSVVRYRLSGVREDATGRILLPRHMLAKVSRPEVAEAFMRPAPEPILQQLLASGRLTEQEARLGRRIPLAGEICVEADSGGHTDQGVAYALMPAMFALREIFQEQFAYAEPILVGAAGGIGTPHAAAAAFAMGADFILTGSINQCTVEADTSESAKDLLQIINVQDTTYAPAGDMFELGAKVQVVKRGLFFPGRANRLYELYQRYHTLDEINPDLMRQIENKYFRRSIDEVWRETFNYYSREHPAKLQNIKNNPRQKMALVFKWYFAQSARLAKHGTEDQKVDYQIQCGPAMGAFNQWVKGTEIESWRQRHVSNIAERIMQGTAEHLEKCAALMVARSASLEARKAFMPARP